MSIINQLNSIRLFPTIVSDEEKWLLEQAATKEELLGILRGFAKEKSPRPDGWKTKLFLSFFELNVQDLLDYVEDSRVRGKVINSIKSTFTALILKGNKPTGFLDYR